MTGTRLVDALDAWENVCPEGSLVGATPMPHLRFCVPSSGAHGATPANWKTRSRHERCVERDSLHFARRRALRVAVDDARDSTASAEAVAAMNESRTDLQSAEGSGWTILRLINCLQPGPTSPGLLDLKSSPRTWWAIGQTPCGSR